MMLKGKQLACTRGERVLFDGLNLELQRGDALRIAGDNGSGKTSLLRMLCGLIEPGHGTVFWNDCNISTIREQFHRQLTFLGHQNGLKDDLSACENVMLSTKLSGNRIDRKAARGILEQIGLGDQVNLPVRALSQGQKRRVALARLPFCSATPLWILDEPFAALDGHAVQMLTDIINRHLENGGMLAYSTHQEVSLFAQHAHTLQLSAPC